MYRYCLKETLYELFIYIRSSGFRFQIKNPFAMPSIIFKLFLHFPVLSKLNKYENLL